ncbi:MAG: lipoprotein [Xanthomonadales bacterium]|nr:lipoprotein [Gammaproteobacteria bacterium]NNE06566.1 lipoprotein [Xanthomonadales bacterium]NNL94749.1 lipoprotein [Xanthomonadales bacterium]
MRRPHIVPTALFVLLLLCACGQKGPLYLPQPEPIDSQAEMEQDDAEKQKKKPNT